MFNLIGFKVGVSTVLHIWVLLNFPLSQKSCYGLPLASTCSVLCFGDKHCQVSSWWLGGDWYPKGPRSRGHQRWQWGCSQCAHFGPAPDTHHWWHRRLGAALHRWPHCSVWRLKLPGQQPHAEGSVSCCTLKVMPSQVFVDGFLAGLQIAFGYWMLSWSTPHTANWPLCWRRKPSTSPRTPSWNCLVAWRVTTSTATPRSWTATWGTLSPSLFRPALIWPGPTLRLWTHPPHRKYSPLHWVCLPVVLVTFESCEALSGLC